MVFFFSIYREATLVAHDFRQIQGKTHGAGQEKRVGARELLFARRLELGCLLLEHLHALRNGFVELRFFVPDHPGDLLLSGAEFFEEIAISVHHHLQYTMWTVRREVLLTVSAIQFMRRRRVETHE